MKISHFQALDHDRLAHSALYTKLHKHHLAKNADILQASSSILTPPPYASPKKVDSKRSSSVADVAIRTKLESRVLSSKMLATEVKTVLDHLRRIVEPLAPSSEKMNGTHDDGGDEDEEAEGDAEDENDDDSETSKRVPAARSDLHASESDEDSSVYDDDELRQVHGGLSQRSFEASESDNEVSNADDAGWESGSISPTSPPPKRLKLGHRATPSVTGGSTDESEEDVQSNDASDSDEVLTSSRFLPSLNVGFTRGESDGSDWSGAEDDANAADGKQRKNRRGQRARQA
jgi:BUD22